MLSSRSNIAILIHGLHLTAENWEEVIWGRPQDGVYGRASKGLMQATRHNADLIFWGSGASADNDGTKESECTFHYAVAHASELAPYNGFDVYEIESMLKETSYIDVVSQSTADEIRAALAECNRREIKELILVSSPTHIARCYQEACKVLAKTRRNNRVDVYAIASDTCFANSTPADVVIFEPPHRGDRPKHMIHKHARRIFSVPSDKMPTFLGDLDELVEKQSQDQ